MKTSLLILIAIFQLSNVALASENTGCQTAEGRTSIITEYIAQGGIVPACGPQCATDFILSKFCSPQVEASCATEEGRHLKIKEFVASGIPVPACGPQCARDYILAKVCPQ